MDIFSQNKILVKLIVAMVVINTALVGYLIWNSTQPQLKDANVDKQVNPNFEYVTAVLKRELELNDVQVEQFQKLRASFFKRERILSLKIRAERDSMNNEMFNLETDSILIDNLAKRIAHNEYQMELARFEQAQELKKICTKKQIEKFETLVYEIRDYFKPDKPTKK